ncbi:MAG: hypothetical protein R3B67_04395 [Phycisphaerales bacterium]
MKKATFYHAGCPVCLSAEESITTIIDAVITTSSSHLGECAASRKRSRAMVVFVPLVVDGRALHINFGASMEDVKG